MSKYSREPMQSACKDCRKTYTHRLDNRSGRCRSCRCKHANQQRQKSKERTPLTETDIERILEEGDRKTWNLGRRW